MKTKHLFVFVKGLGVAFGCLLILQVFLAGPALAQTPGQSVENFISAIRSNDTNTVFGMLEADTNLAQARYVGRSPLNLAAAQGSIEIVDRLLKSGADINAQADTWETMNVHLTALEASIWYGHTNVCKLLLEAGADPNIQSSTDGSALHYAFQYGQTEMAGWLLDHGASPFLVRINPYQKQTPLEIAITQSDGKLVPRMLSEGPKFFEVSNSAAKPSPGRPPEKPQESLAQFLATNDASLLSTAAQRGELEAVQALLKAGVSAKRSPGDDRPLLQTFAIAEAAAAGADHFDSARWLQIRQLLISNGALYDPFSATAMGDLEQARRLAEADKNLSQARDGEGQTPLHWAVQYNQLPMTTFWLEAGTSPAATNFAGQTALHIAAANNLVEHFKLLLAAHAPTDARDTNGWTAFDAATHAQRTEIIRLFLSAKNTPPQTDRAIALPIHQAAASGNLDALVPLVEATNTLEARDELGRTPLQVAVQNGHLAAAALLVDSGASVNARDPDGNTLLHWIILHNYPGVIYDNPSPTWLARMGQDQRKQTYLKFFTNGQTQFAGGSTLLYAGFLLGCGIDATATNHSRQTAMQLALDPQTSPLYGREPLLKMLAGAGGDMNGRDADGNTALHLASQTRDAGWVAGLIKAGADINATNLQGQTPLHKFVENNNFMPPLGVLLDAKPDVNAQDKDGLTPLHVLALAAVRWSGEPASLLLAAGADPNLRDKHGRTPVHLCLSGKFPWDGQFIDLLFKAGANLSAKDDEGKTPLFYLAALGSSKPLFFMGGIAATFLAAKVDINLRDNEGNTPLHVAARTGTRDVFDWLVKQGADMDATNNAGETPRLLAAHSQSAGGDPETDIFQAAGEGRLDSANRLLMADRALANMTNQSGQTPLSVAVMAHRTNMVEFLEKNGAQWDEVSAVMAGRADALREILRQRPSAFSSTDFGRSLLHIAVDNGDVEIIKTLLAANADVQAADFWGLSPLGYALRTKRTDIVALLLQQGAKENLFDAVDAGDLKTASALLTENQSLAFATNRLGASVVEMASAAGQADILKLLLDQGAPVDPASARDGTTPLHQAAMRNQTNTAQLLLQRGAKAEACDHLGCTPLHQTALHGSAEVAALLLQNKANPDSAAAPPTPSRPFPAMSGSPWAGDTALHFAAVRGDTNIIQLLLKSGAAINLTNSTGKTPLDLASQFGSLRDFFTMLPATADLFDPPKIGEFAPINRLSLFMERRQAAAAMLETAGGKRSSPRQGTPGSP
jgi:ankyrin repeat protein